MQHEYTDPVSNVELLQARMKKEMMAANKKQMELKAAAQGAAAAEEERLKQAMLAKFAEDDRLEQMNAQKRRMRGLEHRKEVCSYSLYHSTAVDFSTLNLGRLKPCLYPKPTTCTTRVY